MTQLTLHPAEQNSDVRIELIGSIKAGFPSPAGDFLGERIDLNKYVTSHPDATFYARAHGTSMSGEIEDDDLLIIDRCIPYSDGRIVVCVVDNEFTAKRLKILEDRCLLIPTNPNFPIIEVKEGQDLNIWGVVTHILRKV